jgi:DNA-binding beta-propeller fold protein YncE
LENAGDWVCTACPPSQADIPQASRLSHGNLLELQHRANSEVAFFEGEGFAELLKKGSLGTNALQIKIGRLYKEDLLQSWAPQVIWCLNRERARLRFRLAVLGPPTPSSREEVERFRSGMTRAAKSVLREAASSITRIVAREALAPLEKEITDLLAAEISCAMDDHSSQWQNLEHQVSEACQIAVANAARCISTCLLALMEHEEPSPAWPSVEAEEFVSQQMYVPARFPKFVKAVVKEMSNMLGPWKTKVNAGLKVCVGKIFDVASPFVKMRARLAANPPQIRMRFAHEDVVGLLISAALRYDLCASRLFSKLVDSISDVVEEVQEWSDSRSGERDVLQQRLEKLESTRKELLQILGISTGPPGLAALDEISLARTSCSGVGVSYAWRKMNSRFRITVRGHNGTMLSRSMPGDHRFEVSLLPVGTPSQSRHLVSASRLEHIPVQDNSDGTHTVSYRIPQDAAAGDMELSVQLYGCHVKGSPFSLQVSDEPSWSSVLVLGSGDEELHQPSGLTRLGDDIYVADLISNHILVYRGDAVVRKITFAGSDNGRTGSFNKPWGLAVDDDALYVVESGSDCVKAIGKVDGVLLQTLGSSGSGDGEFRDPRGIVLDGDSLYVVDCGNHRVHVFMRKRGGAFQLERYFGSSGSEEAQFKDPCDLDIDGDYIHVCDQNNHRIQVFGKKAGIYLFTYGSKGTGDGQLWSPTSVVVGESYSYVSDGGNHRIQVFDKSDGIFIKSIAAKGRTNGFLREPGCLALYGDDLYVCEKGNRRVQVFRYGECRL